MPGKTKPTVDPSGHVTYNSQQAKFYQMVQNRSERIEAARNHGVLEYKPSRNPLRAEKTPRSKDHKCFNFSIPEGRKDLKDWERWQYPEIDFGLMGKFRSQKHVYDTYMGKHEDYMRKLENFREEEKLATTQREKEPFKATQEAMTSSRAIDPPGGLWGDEGNQKYDSARASARGNDTSRTNRECIFDELQTETSRVKQTRKKVPPIGQEPDTEKTTISNFRMIAGLNPEALAKWRAQRAAVFVTTQKHPLDPPTARELIERPFLVTYPRGGVEPREHVEIRKIHKPINKYATEAVVNTARLQQGLGALMSELERTESEIERHELKLALKNKTKKY